MADEPLGQVPGLDPHIVSTLASLQITTVDQFIFMSTSPLTLTYLLDVLGTDLAGLNAAMDAVTKSLPPNAPLPTSEGQSSPPSLGALFVTPEIEAEIAIAVRSQSSLTSVGLPPSINHAALMQAIRDQGGRGTCVAFAVTAAHEFASRAQGSPGFSEQFLYEETKRLDGAPNVCGTWQVKAAQVVQNIGQCLHSTWTYNGNQPCNGNGVEPAQAKAEAARFKVNPIVIGPRDVPGAKALLASNHVVGFSIPVYNSWYQRGSPTYRTGDISMRLGSEPAVGGHAMCAVGYQDDTGYAGGGFFILRNSWNSQFGTSSRFGVGYGTIPYAYIANDGMELVSF